MAQFMKRERERDRVFLPEAQANLSPRRPAETSPQGASPPPPSARVTESPTTSSPAARGPMVRAFAAFVLAGAALLGFGAEAQAQTETTVWSVTLTAEADPLSSGRVGFADPDHGDYGSLCSRAPCTVSPPRSTWGGVSRTVDGIPIPTGMQATANGQTQIDLSWNAVVVPAHPVHGPYNAPVRYQLEVRGGFPSVWGDLGGDSLEATSYRHTGHTAGESKEYRVRAWVTHNNANVISPAGGAFPDIVSATTEGSGVERFNSYGNVYYVRFLTEESGVVRIGFNRVLKPTAKAALVLRLGTRRLAFADATTREHDTFAYQWDNTGVSWNSGGQVAVTVIDTSTTVPDAPTGLTATASSKTRIALSWTAPSNTGDTGISLTGYKIEYRAPDFERGGSRWEVLEADTGSTAIRYNHDHVIAPGTRLLYRVSAINARGEGDASNEVEVTTQVDDTQDDGAPDRTGITVSGTTITITFSETLASVPALQSVLFVVQINGFNVRPVTGSLTVSSDTVTIMLPTEDAVDAFDTVFVRYNPPKIIVGHAEVPIATNALQDTEGNLVERWTFQSATNTSPPSVRLVLAPAGISENDGVSTVTAELVPATATATNALTVMVAAEPVAPALAEDFMLSAPATLTIAAGAMRSTEEVTITAVNNDVRAANKTVTVSGAVTGSSEVSPTASPVTLTIQDDDAPENRAPAFTSADAVSVPEHTTVVLTVQASDPDSEDPVTYALVGGVDQAQFTLDASTGELIFRTPPDFERPTDADDDNIYLVTVRATSGTGARALTTDQSLTVTVTDAAEAPDNRAPAFTSPATARVREHTTVVLTVQASDPDSEDPVTYALVGGVDQAQFTLDASTGELIFRTPPDFERPTDADDDNIYLVTVRATSGAGDRVLTAEQTITVTVLDVFETRQAITPTAPLGLVSNQADVAGWQLDLPAGTPVATRITIGPASPGAAPGYRFEAPDGSRNVVAIDIEPFTPGTTVCLAVPDGLQAAAAAEDRPLVLLHRADAGGSWTELPSTPRNGQRCGTPPSASDFAVAMRVVDLQQRVTRLNREILTLQALSLSDQTSRALTQRLATLRLGQPETAQYQLGGAGSLAQTLHATLTAGQGQGAPRVDLKELLGTSSFVLPLRLTATGLGVDRLTLWGQGAYTNLARDADATLDWDGDTVSAQVGADVRLQPDLLAGVTVTWADSGVDYQARPGPGRAVGGTHEHWLVSLQPYLGWQSATGVGLWATVGYGWGEVTLTDDQVGTQESDLTLQTAAVGARGPLLRQTGVLGPGATTVTLKSDATVTRVDVAGNGAAVAEQVVDAGRLRLLLEGQHVHETPTGARVAPFVELGVRYDLGDGLTGVGAELGGGVRYTVPRLGLTVEGRGRGLVGHRGYTEWGASGLVRVDPGLAGHGLAVTLAPTYGPAASRVQQLWAQAPGQAIAPTGGRAALQAGVETEVGYGLAHVAGATVLTPYGAAALGRGAAQYRLGGRWTGGNGLRVSVEGVRQEAAGQQPANQGIRLQAGWAF